MKEKLPDTMQKTAGIGEFFSVASADAVFMAPAQDVLTVHLIGHHRLVLADIGCQCIPVDGTGRCSCTAQDFVDLSVEFFVAEVTAVSVAPLGMTAVF